MTTKEQIIKDFQEYNDDANKNWADEKILQLCNYSEEDGVTKLTISIGKWRTTYHDLVVDDEGIQVKQQSAHNRLLEDVIHYVLNPIFFPQ